MFGMFYVLNTFQEFTFYVVWLGAMYMSHLLTRKKISVGMFGLLSFQTSCIWFYLDIFRLCASIYALASCGHISNFNVLISSLQIFSLH